MLADATALAHSQQALEAATTINPFASEAWSWLAYAFMLDDDRLPAAEEAINHAIELVPGHLDAACGGPTSAFCAATWRMRAGCSPNSRR